MTYSKHREGYSNKRYSKIVRKILNQIERFKGQEEIRGNKGFKEAWYEKLMKKMGWVRGESWCSYAAEAVWKESYKCTPDEDELNSLFSANAVRTFENFKNSKHWKVSKTPKVGALVVWAKYKNGKPVKIDSWTLGHIGVVTEFNEYTVTSADGNTNYGKSREGYVFTEVSRLIDFEEINGLRLLGFVYPNNIN